MAVKDKGNKCADLISCNNKMQSLLCLHSYFIFILPIFIPFRRKSHEIDLAACMSSIALFNSTKHWYALRFVQILH